MSHFEQQVEDLIADTSFIMYCQKKDDREVAVWETRLLTQPELKPVVEEAKMRIKLMTGGLIEAEMETGLARLREAVTSLKQEGSEPAAPIHHLRYRKTRWMAAAGIIAMVSAGWLLYHPGRQQVPTPQEMVLNGRLIVVPAGQHRTMHLPDGSLVILNGGSNMELNETFNQQKREVSLTGEAYFDIKQDVHRPFIIHTQSMNVKVLGTTFNVRSYPDETAEATSLIKGRVEVTLVNVQNNSPVSYILQPMQKLVVDRSVTPGKASSVVMQGAATPAIRLDSLVKNNLVNGYAETAWTDHNLVFYDETLQQAALKMEKWFGIEVVFEKEALRDLKYTGTFENDDLPKVLEIMKLSMPVLKYRIEKNKVILY